MDMDDVMYSTVEDVLEASRNGPGRHGLLDVQAWRSYDGSVVFVDVDDLVGAAGGMSLGAPRGVGAADGMSLGAPRGVVKRRVGYPRAGPGRLKGSALQVRDSLHDVFVVLFATTAYLNLTEIFEPEEASQVDLDGLRNLRHSLAKVTDKALHKKAWDLSRSGYVGALIKFQSGGSRDDEGRHQAVAVEVSLRGSSIVCACSAEEACFSMGACSMTEPVEQSLETVRAALGVTMPDLFEIFGVSLRMRSRSVGRAVLYGNSTCVVRRLGGSWPFAVVRKTRAARWICFSCRTSDGSCDHAVAAGKVARLAAQGRTDTDSESEAGTGESDGDADRAGSTPPNTETDSRGDYTLAQDVSNHEGTRSVSKGLDRSSDAPHSMLPRHIVPPRIAQVERARILRSLQDPSIVLLYPAANACPYCNITRTTELTRREVLVECGEGVCRGMIYVWRCSRCNFRVIPRGRERGIVFSSTSTAYSEVFLFETAVNLSRNGCSLRSSTYLRAAYRELSEDHVFTEATDALGSVNTLRKGIVLYLSLVINGLPAAATRCDKCVRPDGSYSIICFDGLQLGYRLKFMVPFQRSSVSVSPIARASVHAHAVQDEALAKALGGVMSSTVSPTKNSISTLTAMRGNVMAFVVLTGYVREDGAEITLAGSTLAKAMPGKKERGWDPVEDGGMKVEVIEFLRVFFMCRRAARAIAMDIIGAPVDLIRRVPGVVMKAVHATAADLSDDSAEVSGGGRRNDAVSDDGAAESATADAIEDAEADAVDGWASEGDESSDGDAGTTARALGGGSSGSHTYSPPVPEWDAEAPLLKYAEKFSEPALADTGGASGRTRVQQLLLPLRAGVPSTAASSLKVMDFLRAVVVDPFTVWAPRNDWSAIDAVFDCLLDDDGFTATTLSNVLNRGDVTELRLLHGAVACLAPALVGDPGSRRVLGGVLLALIETRGDYDDFVADAGVPDDDEGMDTESARSEADGGSDDEDYTKQAMALAHGRQAFSPEQYTNTWLLPPATASAYAQAYGLPVGERENYLQTGVWAPGLPSVRALPGFVGASSAQTDAPACQHEMGKQQSHTGGTFGGFCTCAHPKCLGVVVLDKSESQRMPLEFVVQRFVTLPDVIVYDFACAALKTALVRLPHVAKKVSLRVDRFHWRKNHTLCSKAMSPDAYVSMDGTNTSSSEERNALSRRQQHHLRQMKQDAFVTFTIYQQALSNVIAMYREQLTRETTIRWPEWYRRTHVDLE